MKSQQYIKFSINTYSLILIILLSIFSFVSYSAYAQDTKFTVVLDAGHGGKDPGTLGLQTFKDSYESDIVLLVTNKLRKLLAKHSDIRTIYTRKKDVFVELHKRGKVANRVNADLFISLHCNAAASTKAYGTTTYVLGMGKTARNLELSKRENSVVMLEDNVEKNYKFDPNDPNSQEFLIGLTLMQEEYLERSIEFAGIMQNKFKTVAKRKDRGINQGNLAVLYGTYMPSVLVEMGFLTNKSEEKFLNSTYGQNKISEAIYKAILTYKKRLENNRVEYDSVQKPDVVVSNTQESKFYRIQIATSRNKIEAKSYNFKGLPAIERIEVGNVYKYFYGVTSDVNDAREMRLKAIKKGFTDAFIVKFNFNKSSSGVHKLNYVNPATNNKKTTKARVSKLSESDVSTVKSKKVNDAVIFKVQLASGRKKVELKSYNFKGLKNVKRVKIGNFYKYYYGNTDDFDLIYKMHKTAKKKGYPNSLIVAIKNGKRISLKEALKK